MNSGCILQVEDDPNDVFFLQHAFATAGISHPVFVASDGQQALEYLAGLGDFADRSKYPLPQMVLLDLQLPRLSGHGVLQWIRAHPRLAPLVTIVFTSSENAGDIERAYRLGANSFIVKPAGIDERAEIAHFLSGWWLKHNKFPELAEETARSSALGREGRPAVPPA